MQSSAASIILFDEPTGMKMGDQDSYIETPTDKQQQATTEVLPWREWLSFNTLGATEADKATAVAVLHGLHEAFDVTAYPIEIVIKNKQVRVYATGIIEPWTVCFPPCVPKQSRVLDISENPNAARIDVVALRAAVDAVNSPEGHILRSKSFFVAPEFKTPTRVKPKAAVAAATNDNLSEDRSWLFGDTGPDTMHPFWGVRRLTQQALDKERTSTEVNEWLPALIVSSYCRMSIP